MGTIKDLFSQSSPRAPGTASFAEAWCQDAGTYPIIVIMGIATLLCTASVFHHTRMPTTTWNKQDRMSLDYIAAENAKTAEKTKAFKRSNLFSAGPGFSTLQ